MNRSDVKFVPIALRTNSAAPRQEQTRGFLSLIAFFLSLFLSATTVSADDITWTFTGVVSSTELPAVGAIGDLFEMTFSIDENAPNLISGESDVFFSRGVFNISAQINGVTVYDGNNTMLHTFVRLGSEAVLGRDEITWRARNTSGTDIEAQFYLPTFVLPAFPALNDSLQANMIALAGPGDSRLSYCLANEGGCVLAIPMTSYTFAAAPPIDSDSDGIPDTADNCTLISNADQRDTNADGYGNICDPDLDNNGVVNFIDITSWVPFFNTATTGDADFNGDGSANFADFSIFPLYFLQPPGPSGVAP